MEKIIVSIIICIITFGIIFININNEEEKNKENENIGIILETEEGNLKSDTFPNKENYEYSKVLCENTNNIVTPTFNIEEWKLNLSVEEKVIDGNFNCNIYFKEKIKLANEIIIAKATEENNEGLIKIEQPKTEQTPELTEYRYSGSNEEVKNYITFNNETWRIIGVFPTEDASGNIENRVKIMREESIGDYSWDTSTPTINNGGGVNQWGSSGSYEGADLMKLLNPGYESESVNNSLYWNREGGNCYSFANNTTTACDFSSTGLASDAKNMIDNAKWYTAASNTDITTQESYTKERGSEVGTADTGINITKTTNWVGKIGLIYPSDYGYASSGCRNGEYILSQYYNETCINTNWLRKDHIIWFLNPSLTYNNRSQDYDPSGYVGSGFVYRNIHIHPSVYLKSVTKITSGDGTKENPYTLSL